MPGESGRMTGVRRGTVSVGVEVRLKLGIGLDISACRGYNRANVASRGFGKMSRKLFGAPSV